MVAYARVFLEEKISRGEITHEEASSLIDLEVDSRLEEFRKQLDQEGYSFYYRDSTNILDHQVAPGRFFFIRDEHTDFEFIFGGVL